MSGWTISIYLKCSSLNDLYYSVKKIGCWQSRYNWCFFNGCNSLYVNIFEPTYNTGIGHPETLINFRARFRYKQIWSPAVYSGETYFWDGFRFTAKSTATRFVGQEIHQTRSIDEKYSKTIVSDKMLADNVLDTDWDSWWFNNYIDRSGGNK